MIKSAGCFLRSFLYCVTLGLRRMTPIQNFGNYCQMSKFNLFYFISGNKPCMWEDDANVYKEMVEDLKIICSYTSHV